MSAKKGEYGTEFVTADKLASLDLNEVYNMLAQGRYAEAMHRVKAYLARLGVFVFRADVIHVDVERGVLTVYGACGVRVRVHVPTQHVEIG
jgi:hypothetical protein